MNGKDKSETWIVYLSVNVSSGEDQTLPSNLRQNGMQSHKYSGGVVFSVQDAISSSQVPTKDPVTEMFPDGRWMASALVKANTKSGSMNQQRRCSMLPNEVRSLFTIKSKNS